MYTLNVAEFQSTHPVRGATDYAGSAPVGRRVSIHAPREGCDGDVRWWRDHAGVSIHAPREGCDALPRYVFWRNAGFQSTHPVRGATWEVSGYPSRDAFQSTHPVRGATGHGNRRDNRRVVSIHAPREGCDSWSVPRRRWTTRFNPRTP